MKLSRLAVLVSGMWVAMTLSAATLTVEYTDGVKFTGDVIQKTPAYLQLRVGGVYTNLSWGQMSQDTLKELQTVAANTKDTKLAAFVEPYIEIPEEEVIKKTQVEIKPVSRLERPAKGSLFGALTKSPVGLVCLLLLFVANIYAAYEISVVRAYAPALVCGVAAVAPVIGPVIFLCLPTKLPSNTEGEEEAAPVETAAIALPSAAHAEDAAAASAAPDASSAAAVQSFKRGQFTFNRRFIETKFSTFFQAVRRGSDKDTLLVVKTGRGEHVANRITRIAASDMHLEVLKGGATQEVQVAFSDIQEIQLKPKDA